jgi:hypothetical protein
MVELDSISPLPLFPLRDLGGENIPPVPVRQSARLCFGWDFDVVRLFALGRNFFPKVTRL